MRPAGEEEEGEGGHEVHYALGGLVWVGEGDRGGAYGNGGADGGDVGGFAPEGGAVGGVVFLEDAEGTGEAWWG